MEDTYAEAIRKAKEGKAAGPDGVPMEILQMCPVTYAELLYELFAAGARLGCVMKEWDLSTLNPNLQEQRPGGRACEPPPAAPDPHSEERF